MLLGRYGVGFGIMLGCWWTALEMLLAAARGTFGENIGSVLGSVLELISGPTLTPILGSCWGRFGTNVGLPLSTFNFF